MATVIRTCGIEQGRAILELDCHHYTTVPAEDEESLSFIGAEVECDRHITEEQADAIMDRSGVLVGIWTDHVAVKRLASVAAAHARHHGWISEWTTREERCRNLSQ